VKTTNVLTSSANAFAGSLPTGPLTTDCLTISTNVLAGSLTVGTIPESNPNNSIGSTISLVTVVVSFTNKKLRGAV
jgi:hypothetical protein